MEIIDSGFIVQLFVLMIGPIPGFDMYLQFCCENDEKVYYQLSDFLLALMWLRLIFIMRAWLNYSIFTDAYAKILQNAYGFESSLQFTLRCHLLVYPKQTVMTLYSTTILTAAYLIRIFEKPYFRKIGQPSFDSYFESIWFTTVTFSTIGYGDISPGTNFGKLIVIVLAFWSVLLTSLLVVTVSSIFQMSSSQEMAFRHIKLTRSAAKAITKGVLHFRAKRDAHMLHNKFNAGKDGGDHKRRKSNFLDLIQENSKPLRESEEKICNALEDKIQNIVKSANMKRNIHMKK